MSDICVFHLDFDHFCLHLLFSNVVVLKHADIQELGLNNIVLKLLNFLFK